MQGWKIFTHSLGMVFNNLGAALRISLVLYLINSAVGIYFGSKYGDVLNGMESGSLLMIPQGFWWAWFVTMLIGAITSLWIAVSWHRYILLEENPDTFVPPFHSNRIGAYFLTSLMIGILIVLIIVAVGFIVSLVLYSALGDPVSELFLKALILGIVSYVFYRMGLALPAAALGNSLGIGSSIQITKQASGAIFQIVVIGILVTALTQIPSYFNSDPSSILNLVYTYVIGWFIMMGSVSILTTLYGVYVENREL